MAPAQRYPSPAQQMTRLAREARDEGLTFEAFWLRAVRPGESPPAKIGDNDAPKGAVLWPRDTWDRQIALYAINATKDSWERAYTGADQLPREAALSILAPIFDRLSGRAPVPGVSSPGADARLAAAA